MCFKKQLKVSQVRFVERNHDKLNQSRQATSSHRRYQNRYKTPSFIIIILLPQRSTDLSPKAYQYVTSNHSTLNRICGDKAALNILNSLRCPFQLKSARSEPTITTETRLLGPPMRNENYSG